MTEINNKLKVLYVSAEVSPFSKVGGLADVAGSLPPALAAAGVDIRVVSPCYARVCESHSLECGPDNVILNMGGAPFRVGLKKLSNSAVPYYFLDCPHYFDRPDIYNYPDDSERFIAFCRGVLATVKELDWRPDVIHCNDWQTALIPALLKTSMRDDPFFAGTACVFTIHNLEYQGVFPPHFIEASGLPWEEYHFTKMEFFDNVNLMKAGITYSDRINTVSRQYMNEIQTGEFGCQLDTHLGANSHKLHGILNGLDINEFDPCASPRIFSCFSADNLSGKIENKRKLCELLGLQYGESSPLLGIVSRLTEQKGVDLLVPVIEHLMETGNDIRIAILGTGDPHYENLLADAASRWPGKVAARLTFDTVLADRIYAGSDIFLMPSRFEPCGLGQMIAMRFGTIPVARAVGGLVDTVKDFSGGEGTGFLFTDYTTEAFLEAIKRALDVYAGSNNWRTLVQTTMQKDFSWNRSAHEYIEMYRLALG